MDYSPNGVTAIVEYDYIAKESDELTLKKGAIITNIINQPGGWWEGTILSSGKTGMFPDNFVRVLEPNDKNPVVLRDKSATQNRRCKVIYSYKENKNDELSLAVGDIIEFYEEVEEGWWRGNLNGKVGVFPSNFVEILETVSPISANRKSANNNIQITNLTKSDSINKSRTSLNSSREDLDKIISSQHHHAQQILHDAPSLPPKPIKELCKVLFAYNPANDDELKLVEADVITILSKELPDKGWWKGELRGKVGVFPDNFVALLPPEMSPVKENNLHKPDRPPPASKMLITKSPNNSANSSYRKDSFGSRDSLNDSGITSTPPIGNVAAHRKSLEHKNVEITPPTTNEKPPRKGLDTKTTSDIRKSVENLDEKKTPPPVVGKKPAVPVKKSPSITLNIFKKSSSTDKKLHSHDSMDGVGSSKITSEVADNNEKNVLGERLSKDYSEFGHVERGSVLKDMRANRAKAPKRRPPSSAVNLIGESYNVSGMSNGNSGYHNDPESPKPDLLNTSHHSSSNDEELVAKPKTREWEKHKAPWLDELKVNQEKKKTSPSIEPKSPDHNSNNINQLPQHHHQDETKVDMSKSSHITSSSSSVSANKKLTERSATTITDTTIQNNNNNSSFERKEQQQHSTTVTDMTKSMSSLSTKISISDNSTHETTNSIRPTSVNLRNRSISPTPITRHAKSIHIVANEGAVNPDNVCSRVIDLEHKVTRLEKMLSSQNQVIEDLSKSLRDESDKVKILQKELEKYAQCVTQV